MERLDDLSLMNEVQLGNRDAFTQLVNRHSKYYFAIVYRFVNNREIAEDILQNAWLKLWEKAHKFDGKIASFKTWFTRSVINICIDDRRGKQYVRNIDDFEIADSKIGAPEMVEKQQKYNLLQNAINKLSTNYRTALNLGVIEEMPYRDVAQVMRKSEAAVKVLIHRALAQLKDIMKGREYAL